MKIIFLNGGLANQVFQYIFYRNATLLYSKEDWYLDDSFFFVHQFHNGYELGKVFGLKPKLLSEFFDTDVWDYMIEQKRTQNKSIPQQLLENDVPIKMIADTDNYTKWNPFSGQIAELAEPYAYHPEIFSLIDTLYYHGYWIVHDYFYTYRDLFMSELSFPQITDDRNLKYLEQIRQTNSASLHIRRGDYVTIGMAPSDEDYRILVGQMLDREPDATLFVFSDDLDYCKDHAKACGLNLPEETIFVEGNAGERAFRDMQLMSHCRNMIINNSAFCYLAGLLNQNLRTLINPSGRIILPLSSGRG